MSASSDFAGKCLLLVGTGGAKRRHVLESLASLGLRRLVCLHDRPNWAAPYVDEWIEADPARPSPVTLDLVRARLPHLDGVLTYDDYSVVLAAELAAALGVAGVSPEGARRSKDKHAFRSLLAARGLPTPRFLRLDPARTEATTSVAMVASALSFPVVVKPTHGAGSVLVRRADDHLELLETLRGYAAALEREPAAALWPDRTVVVEEYLEGAEVDIDMLVQQGELRYAAVTDNFAPTEPYFLEQGGQIPSALPASAQRELVSVAFEVLSALAVRDACVHFEARWTSRGAVPIEANLRLGGAEVYAFARGAYGVDLVECAARIALGLPIPARSDLAPRAYLRSTNFVPPCAGSLRSICIDDAVKRDPSLHELVIFREVGDAIRRPPDGFDYLGWLVAAGATRTAADESLVRLASGIRFEIGSTSFSGAPA